MLVKCLSLLKIVNRDFDIQDGICNYLYYNHCHIDLTKYFETFPKFSGDNTYPIKGEASHIKEYITFRIWAFSPKKEYLASEYHKVRCELLDHIISEIEKEIRS